MSGPSLKKINHAQSTVDNLDSMSDALSKAYKEQAEIKKQLSESADEEERRMLQNKLNELDIKIERQEQHKWRLENCLDKQPKSPVKHARSGRRRDLAKPRGSPKAPT